MTVLDFIESEIEVRYAKIKQLELGITELWVLIDKKQEQIEEFRDEIDELEKEKL